MLSCRQRHHVRGAGERPRVHEHRSREPPPALDDRIPVQPGAGLPPEGLLQVINNTWSLNVWHFWVFVGRMLVYSRESLQ